MYFYKFERLNIREFDNCKEKQKMKNSDMKIDVKSKKKKILLIILPFTIISMILLSSLSYYFAYKIIEQNIEKRKKQELLLAVEKIEKYLSINRSISESIAKSVQANKDIMTPDNYKNLLSLLLSNNNNIFGIGVYFEPFSYKPDLKHYSQYCIHENDKVKFMDNYYSGKGKDYVEEVWYKNVKGNNSTVWSLPYYDEISKVSKITASTPFFTKDGKFSGIATSDINLTEMRNIILELESSIEEKAMLIDEKGTYIADNDMEKILKLNIIKDDNLSLSEFGKTMVIEKNGTGEFTIGDEKYRAWYTQIPETNWIVAISASKAVLYSELNEFTLIMAIICISVIFIVSLIIFFVVRKNVVKPADSFQKDFEKASDGDLNSKLKSDNDSSNSDKLKDILEKIKKNSKETLLSVKETNAQIDDRVLKISKTNDGLSEINKKQSEKYKRLKTSISKFSENELDGLEYIKDINEYSTIVEKSVSVNNENMKTIKNEINEMDISSDNIIETTNTLESLAFQINILAVNALIEAERIGDRGRGFCIVVDEIRNLLVKSTAIVQNFGKLIINSNENIIKGQKIAEQIMEIIDDFQEKHTDLAEKLSKVEKSSHDQLEIIKEVDLELTEFSDEMQNSELKIDENSSIINELSEQLKTLNEEISKFKIVNLESDIESISEKKSDEDYMNHIS